MSDQPAPAASPTTLDARGLAAAVVLVASWSLPGVFVRRLGELGALTVASSRLGVAAALLLPAVLVVPGWRAAFARAAREPGTWALASLMTGYYMTATLGFREAPIAIAALLVSSSPAWYALGRPLLGERTSAGELAGVGLAMLGLAAVLLPEAISGDSAARNAVAIGPLGVAMPLAAAFCSAGFVAARARVGPRERTPSVVLVCMTSLLGVPLFAGAALADDALAWDRRQTLELLGLGVISTATPTLCYAIAAARLPASVTAMLNPLVPIGAGTAAFVFLGERLTLWTLPGGAAVVAGLAVVVRASRRAGRVAAPAATVAACSARSSES